MTLAGFNPIKCLVPSCRKWAVGISNYCKEHRADNRGNSGAPKATDGLPALVCIRTGRKALDRPEIPPDPERQAKASTELPPIVEVLHLKQRQRSAARSRWARRTGRGGRSSRHPALGFFGKKVTRNTEVGGG